MMMQRRHAKNPLARELERANLNDDRKRFEHENATNKKKQNLLLDDYGHHADCAAERERPHVAHEHLGRMRVVPEKPQRSAAQRPAKNYQFARRWYFLNLQIFSHARV